ncbi:MAG: CPBP family intramembrane metalloprotease, partial [Clostridia bacterium]|nr:CPBP family intramembrane metalloprotease [Clostridia bacterium]
MNDNEYPYGSNGENGQYPYGQNGGNGQYPYGQNRERPPYPYGGGGNSPYGNGGQPYGYYPPKKNFGQKLREAFADPSRRNLMLLGMAAGTGVLLYLLLSTAFSFVLSNVGDLYDRYLNDEVFSLLAETMYSMFCLALPFTAVFAVARRVTGFDRPLPFQKPRGGWQAVLLVPAGLGLCFIGNVLSNYIVTFANSVGVTFRSYETAMEQQGDAPETLGLLLLTVVHTAVLPALLEELIFRGYIMQPLRRYGDWFAIITSALIFGLVHGNMMQVPFAILAGVAL